MSVAEQILRAKADYDEVYEAGYKGFLNDYQNNGNRTYYEYAFAGRGWNDTRYNPKYPITATSYANYMFTDNYNITSTKVPIIIGSSQSIGVFYYCIKLKTIPNIKVTDKVVFTSWFTSCSALEEIYFTEDSVIGNSINLSACTKLILDCLKSIIKALKDFSGTDKEFTCKLTLSAESKAILEAEGAAAPNGDTWLNYAQYAKCWNI